MRCFPGFDAIRIAAAAGVVLSHSYLIAEGSEANEPFQKYTGEILGVYSVLVFFMLSGFLVTDSACRSKSCLQFGVKRFRRIAPGFIVNISAVTILICP